MGTTDNFGIQAFSRTSSAKFQNSEEKHLFSRTFQGLEKNGKIQGLPMKSGHPTTVIFKRHFKQFRHIYPSSQYFCKTEILKRTKKKPNAQLPPRDHVVRRVNTTGATLLSSQSPRVSTTFINTTG